jgi:hypothetical protein
MMTERYHRHSLLDTIECSILGWQDKPLRLAKRPIPLDYMPDEEDAPESMRGQGAFANLSQAVLAYLHRVASDGRWVWREDIATALLITNEKHFGESLAQLVGHGQIERRALSGASTAFRLLKGPAPEKVHSLLKARMMRALGGDWVSCGGLAERLGVHSSRVADAGNQLVREGVAEVRRTTAYSERKQGSANEYRLSRKTLVARLAKG